MWEKNSKLRREGEQLEYTKEMIDEYIRCKEDIIYFAENYFYITTIDYGKIKIKLFDFQKKILKAYTEPPNNCRHCIVLASRQIGKTTVSSIYLIHYLLFNSHKTVAVLANKEKTALEIMRRIKMAYENLPLWLQVGIKEDGWNKESLLLENGNRLVAATTSTDSISGETISLLYLDEFAKIKEHIAEEFITATLPVITSGKTSKVIIVSTANGLNFYYDFWINAVRQVNGFFPIKIPWWHHPERDEKWKEETLQLLNGNLSRFNQEYNCQFLGTSNTLIDPETLEKTDFVNPIDYKWNGLLRIYEHPIEGQLYILGIDTAKGTGKDNSVIQVLRIINEHDIRQVAVYMNNRIDTHEYAQVCIGVSEYYNSAYMMIENNSEGGETANVIWHEYENENILNCDDKGIGIRSTKKSKLAANLNLKRYMENKWLTLVDKETVNELSKYVEISPNVFRSETKTTPDDHVTSLLWGLYFVTTDYFDDRDISVKTLDEKYVIDDEDKPIFFYSE
jgi:hypothetical protein